ncbi:MAG: hypothetical protein JXQ82_03365 [Methanomicrobiaceae archaeon]|nr:hypothetical protein [Methanomicrobiaceae archaeon]
MTRKNYVYMKKNIEIFYKSPFFLGLTIGIPFCLFKILFGGVAFRIGAAYSDFFLTLFGEIIIFWAGTDILMNFGKIFLDILHKENYFEYCTIAQVGRIFQKPAVFLALDTLLSFSIICFMLWSGWIIRLTVFESYLWYFATTLNLISLSLVSLHIEIIRSRESE